MKLFTTTLFTTSASAVAAATTALSSSDFNQEDAAKTNAKVMKGLRAQAIVLTADTDDAAEVAASDSILGNLISVVKDKVKKTSDPDVGALGKTKKVWSSKLGIYVAETCYVGDNGCLDGDGICKCKTKCCDANDADCCFRCSHGGHGGGGGDTCRREYGAPSADDSCSEGYTCHWMNGYCGICKSPTALQVAAPAPAPKVAV